MGISDLAHLMELLAFFDDPVVLTADTVLCDYTRLKDMDSVRIE